MKIKQKKNNSRATGKNNSYEFINSQKIIAFGNSIFFFVFFTKYYPITQSHYESIQKPG